MEISTPSQLTAMAIPGMTGTTTTETNGDKTAMATHGTPATTTKTVVELMDHSHTHGGMTTMETTTKPTLKETPGVTPLNGNHAEPKTI